MKTIIILVCNLISILVLSVCFIVPLKTEIYILKHENDSLKLVQCENMIYLNTLDEGRRKDKKEINFLIKQLGDGIQSKAHQRLSGK